MKRKRKGKNRFSAIASHKAFLPILALWGASLLGLVMMVLPDTVIATLPALTGVEMSLMSARFILAFVATIAGALLALIVGSALRGQALKDKSDEGAVVSAFKSRSIQPIDPTADLGSESLDSPIDEAEAASACEETADPGAEPTEPQPTLGELAQRGFEMEAPDAPEDDSRGEKSSWAFTRKDFKDALIESCEGATCEAAEAAPMAQETPAVAETPEVPAPAPAPAPTSAPAPALAKVKSNTPAPASKPREMALQEFADLPGRNAVWVEDPASSGLQSAKRPARPSPQPASALEKLRQTPTDQLSLVEMVERFAAALHSHQNQTRARMALGQVGRDAALAEALKALTLFTESGFDQGGARSASDNQIGETERELREALARLQNLRGAA